MTLVGENSSRLIFKTICYGYQLKHREGKAFQLIVKHHRRHFHSVGEDNRHTWTILTHLHNKDIKKADKKYACFLLNITDESFGHFEKHKYVWDAASLKIAVDGSANCLAKRKIIHTADVVCGDFDSIDPRLLEQLRCPTKISKLPLPKDQKTTPQTVTLPQVIETASQKATDFTKSIRVAVNKRPDINHFIGLYHSDGTRTDHLFGLVNTLHLIKKSIILLNVQSNTTSWLLCPGSHTITKQPGRDLCSLVPFTGPTEVKTEGLEYNVHSTHLCFGGMISTSNICDKTSEFVKVETDRDLFWSVDVGSRAD